MSSSYSRPSNHTRPKTSHPSWARHLLLLFHFTTSATSFLNRETLLKISWRDGTWSDMLLSLRKIIVKGLVCWAIERMVSFWGRRSEWTIHAVNFSHYRAYLTPFLFSDACPLEGFLSLRFSLPCCSWTCGWRLTWAFAKFELPS